MSELILPSWQDGLAPRDGPAAHPGLLNGLIDAWEPGLDPTGGTLRGVVRKNHGVLTSMDPATDWIIGGNPRSLGYVLDYNAAGNQVLMPSQPTYALDDFSVVTWIRRDGWAAGYAYIFALHSFGSGFAITRNNVGDDLTMWVNGSDAGSSNTIVDLTWTHVVCTRKGTVCTVYYDGVDVTTDSVWSGSATLTAGQISIGDSVGPGARFNGQVGGTYLYDRVLTAAEARQHYEIPRAPFALARRTLVAVAAAGGITATPASVALTWSVPSPGVSKAISPAALSASWSVPTPATGLVALATPLTATWAIPSVACRKTIDVSPLGATWTIAAATTRKTAVASALAAAWSTPAVGLQKTHTPSPASATWSVPTPTTSLDAGGIPITLLVQAGHYLNSL